eukprot:TRINITY_DN3489_c0_g1_i15.p3 TRINITY_DN3489_c0_g1~~TRINITY_DN3489_c0_g1_i15.p3  ORF type:complete len:259 (-),score=30.44 TRINITY_DN3489_c0_g1_i15:746-1522(-)
MFQIHKSTTVGIFVPLVFGSVVMVISFAVSRLGAGQLNPAVSIALYAARKQNLIQTIGMILAEFAGALVGVGLLAITVPNSSDSKYGATMVMPGVEVWNALVGEIMMTLILMFAILETSVSKFGGLSGPIAMGFSVFIAHGVLLPLDGCSLNPARSLGPAVWAGIWDDFWVFVVGPIVGALLAVPIHFYTELAPAILDFSPPDAPSQFLAQKYGGNQEGRQDRYHSNGGSVLNYTYGVNINQIQLANQNQASQNENLR